MTKALTGCIGFLKSLYCKNLGKLVFTNLNISSIRNKFELISKQVRRNINVLMVSETRQTTGFRVEIF